jgi:chromosome segregation ATPase
MNDSLRPVRAQTIVTQKHAVIAAALLSLVACRSAPKLRVDKDVLEKITIENKLLLFDAENELNIAIDSRDQVVDEIEQIKDDIKRMQKKREVALRDADTFSDKGDKDRAQIAAARAQEASAHIEYLHARLDWVRERLVRERAKLIVAKAQFELAKARLVKKNNVPGASDIDLADFETQVANYTKDVDGSTADIKEAEAEMKAAEQTWTVAVKQLQTATGGALGSRWLE